MHLDKSSFPEDLREVVTREQEIVLQIDSKFPKRIILAQGNRIVDEYRLVKTKLEKLILNK